MRVETVSHIRHVLMAEQFQNNTRHHGHTALAVIRLFELPSGPLGGDSTQVFGDRCLNPVCQITVDLLSVSSVPEGRFVIIVLGGIDSERADNSGVVSAVQAVSMQGEAEVDGGIERVDPHSTTFHVVLVFIALIEVPERGVRFLLNEPVPCPFGPLRHAG